MSNTTAAPALVPSAPVTDLPEARPLDNEALTHGNAESASLGDEIRQREFRIIIDTLRHERGRRNRAAEKLGISPRTLRYKLAQMREFGIDPDVELAMA